jgi:hypothetical protein
MKIQKSRQAEESMHRYNTRLQSKKAANVQEQQQAPKEQAPMQQAPMQQAPMQQAPVQKAPKQPLFVFGDILCGISSNSAEKQKEIQTIKSYLNRIEEAVVRVTKISITIELFHYLEHHHIVLKENPAFRTTVLRKCDEFINIAYAEDDAVHACDQLYHDHCMRLNVLLDQVRIATAAKILYDACVRVSKIINQQL